MGKQSYWDNDDGLVVGFGPRTTENNIGGAVNSGGSIEGQIVLDITDATALTDSSVPTNFFQGAKIPANTHIRDAVFVTNTAWTGTGTPTLDIGTVKSDGTFKDDDGIDAAIGTANLGADAVVNCDGAQVDTVITEDLWLAATWDGDNFEAGSGKLYVTYVQQEPT